jgi:hypothetical protein
MARAGSADLPDGESEKFLREGLDRFLLICPSDCFRRGITTNQAAIAALFRVVNRRVGGKQLKGKFFDFARANRALAPGGV